MCNEMGSQYKSLLYHSDVRWLSRRKILSRVISLRSEIYIFLTEKNHSHSEKFNDPACIANLAFLSDMFQHLNHLNIEIQGKNQTIVDVSEQVLTFKLKLAHWCEKRLHGKIRSFPRLNKFLENSNNDIYLENTANIFQEYMTKLQQELNRYKLENVELCKYSWVGNPFNINVHKNDEDINRFQEELIDLQANKVLKDHFSSKSLTQFWAQLKNELILKREENKVLLLYPTTYLCEAGFSALVVIKTKYRNRLDLQYDMRCVLTINIKPNIED